MSGQAVIDIGKNTINLVANTTNQAIKTADALASASLKTAETVGTAALDTTAVTSTAVGEAIAASAQTASSVVGIVRDLAKRTQEISKEAAKRQIDVENLKNSEIKRLTTVGKVNNEEKTQTEIEKIKAEQANEKLKIEKDAEDEKRKIEEEAEHRKLQAEIKAAHEKREIEADAETKKIEKEMNHQMRKDEALTNERNYKESLAYGFKTDKQPYKAGSTEITKWFGRTEKKYFGYYILISIINPNTFDSFELKPKDLTKEQIHDINRERNQNQNEFTYMDKTGNEVLVVFQKKYKKSFLSSNLIETKTDILVYDKKDKNTPITNGIPVFLKKNYFIIQTGGKSKKQTKIKSRRKNRKQIKRKSRKM